MKRVKRLGTLLLALCMLFSFAPVVSAENDGTIKMTLNSNTMTVNGVDAAIDADPAIKPQVKTVNGAGYTMLPLRAVVEAVGGTVAYDAATKVITLTYGDTILKHTIGTKTATVNGLPQTMSIESYAANNRTYVHLRAIELLSDSIQVIWSAEAKNDVTISYPQIDPAEDDTPAESERVPADVYTYDISGNADLIVEGLIFSGDVTITGENGRILFANCAFNGDLINQGGEGARVVIEQDCAFADGVECVLDSALKEATMETDLPKFLIFCEMPGVSCVNSGSVITFADQPIRLNGESYAIESAELFINEMTGESGAYSGQEANIHNFAKWIEGGENVLLHIALFSE